jgi:hypothetical protein
LSLTANLLLSRRSRRMSFFGHRFADGLPQTVTEFTNGSQ